MFIIEKLFIDDKKLAPVLTALAGLVISMEPPRPVVNATVTSNKVVKQISTNGGTMIGRVADAMTMHKGQRITTDQLKEIIKVAGGNPSSLSGTKLWLTKNKQLKGISRGQYQVL